LSKRPPKNAARLEPVVELLHAAREYSTAAVIFHGAVAQRFGLSASDLKTLDILQRLGPLAAGEIARQTGLASASVTSLIDRLEEKRLVRRQRDNVDRRRVVVNLTPAVAKTIAPFFESLSRRMLACFRRYGAHEIAILKELLACGAREMRDEATKLSPGDDSP
jgi:DNA-binding MarR family transcriptional regulator